ncbi:phage-related protein [Leuconostoc phage 1-A4]|uniref:Phage-related protein n=1 Tax=Leuconostoc phage 1-A4 TaxID=745088 RepID=D4N4M2_9CAUD|nr:nucleotide kinase [Leuconostoc phage 1-A4]ADD71772.1 phage-related protein [Leuconostoc phage 1-A4]
MSLKVIIKSRRTGLYIKEKNGTMTSNQSEAVMFSHEVLARIFLNTNDFIPSEYSFVLLPSEYLPNVKNVTKEDEVNHPKHYNSYSFEVVDVIDEVVPNYPASYSGHIQNAIKYIFRAPFKGTLKKDLKKAVWYLNHAIEIIDKEKY